MIAYTIHPEAEAEIDAAAVTYESQQRGLSASFVAAVEQAVSFLRTYPRSGTPVGRSFRRVLVSRFPHAIIYRLDSEGALIIAVAHTARRPDYWRHQE